METFELGPISLTVEHRSLGADGGPTLRVRDGSRGRELLRFDCFAQNAHWHVDPSGANTVRHIEAADPVEWTLGRLRAELASDLAHAGFTAALPEAREALLAEIERELRRAAEN